MQDNLHGKQLPAQPFRHIDKLYDRNIALIQTYPIRGWYILILDAVFIWISFGISYYLRYEQQFLRPVDEINTASFEPFIPYTLLFIFWVLLIYNGGRLYEVNRERSVVNEAFIIINGASNGLVVVMAISFWLRPLVFSRLMLLQAAIITIILLIGFRVILRLIRNWLYTRGVGVERVLVIGAGEVGRYVISTIVARPDMGYKLVGFVDDDAGVNDLGRVPALGNPDNLEQIINTEDVSLVIVTLPWRAQRRILEIVQQCERKNVAVRTVPDLFQLSMSQVQVETLGGIPMLGVRHDIQIKPMQLFAKRIMDVLITVLLLPFFIPIMLMTAIAIRLDTPGPIFFTQERVGLNGQIFKIIKFRSMRVGAEQEHEAVRQISTDDPEGKDKLGDDPRITRVGHFIRRTSIDELPQLFNVLKGDMSLVGPRPALEQEVRLYQTWQQQRLRSLPGITGLWQISGRSDIPFEEKVLLDIYYIENWSLALDLQILMQTAPKVISRQGAY